MLKLRKSEDFIYFIQLGKTKYCGRPAGLLSEGLIVRTRIVLFCGRHSCRSDWSSMS